MESLVKMTAGKLALIEARLTIALPRVSWKASPPGHRQGNNYVLGSAAPFFHEKHGVNSRCASWAAMWPFILKVLLFTYNFESYHRIL